MMPPVRGDDQDNSFDGHNAFQLLNAGNNMESSNQLHNQSQHQHQQQQHQSSQPLSQLSSSPSNQLGQMQSQLQPVQTHQSQMQQQPQLSKAELRKSNKPIMEKKRRARINHCLNELKTLILEAMKKDPARHTKLEKADILEMTVKYLQTMQRSQVNMNVQSDPTVLHKFKAGFSDCTDEVSRYINQIDGVDTGVKQRLMGHLNNCVTGIQQVAAPYTYSPSAAAAVAAAAASNTNAFRTFGSPLTAVGNVNTATPLHQQSPISLPMSQDINNNGRSIQMGGVQLIPSRLPTGELALVMPNSCNLPYFPSNTFPIGRNSLDLSSSSAAATASCTLPRVSAFNSVTKSNSGKHLSTDTSPPLSPASSMSSGDDSSSLTQHTDYQPLDTTPPLQMQQNFLNAFPTPPSGGSITMIPSISINRATTQVQHSTVTSATTTLQQPQVTSTTEPPLAPSSNAGHAVKVKPLSVITNTAGNTQTNTRSDVQYVNKKRPYPIDFSSDDSSNGLLKVANKSEPPSEKQTKPDEQPQQNQNDADNCNGDMWRPW